MDGINDSGGVGAWDLLSINLKTAREHAYSVAVLPVGAVEAHNLHLPEGQDVLHTRHVSAQACRYAWGRGAQVLLLPALPYGVDSNLLSYPFTIHVSQATLDAMIVEIAASVRHHGIRKFVIVNGHGGNDFVPLVRQLQHEQEVFAFLCDWWRIGQDRYSEIFEAPDDHAGEMETSIALALYPERVALENAKDGNVRPFSLAALNAGWVKTSRDFGRLNDHCAAGDPSRASADKGRRYLELTIRRLGDFLVELAEAELDEHFPFQRDSEAD